MWYNLILKNDKKNIKEIRICVLNIICSSSESQYIENKNIVTFTKIGNVLDNFLWSFLVVRNMWNIPNSCVNNNILYYMDLKMHACCNFYFLSKKYLNKSRMFL